MGFFSKLFGNRTPSSVQSSPAAAPARKVAHQPQSSPKPVVPPDWRTSSVHLMALERFLDVRAADGAIPDYWASSLGASPQAVVQSFIDDGLLLPVPLVRTVEYCSSAADLKAMAKERGLKVSGRKEELAQRLMEADPHGMAKLFEGKLVVTCSVEARVEVERFKTQKAQAWDCAVVAVRNALETHDFRAAIETARHYLVTEVRIEAPNPLAIPTTEGTVDEDIAYIETIYRIRPRILKELAAEEWTSLATVVAMGHLLGRMPTSWLPETFKGVEKFDNEVALRMMNFHLGHLNDIARMRSAGITKAKVLDCGGGSCEACQKMAGKVRKLDSLPELPYEHCTCHLGCRCTLIAELDLA